MSSPIQASLYTGNALVVYCIILYITIFFSASQPPYTYILTLHYGYGIGLHRMSDVITLTYYEPRVMEQDIFLHLKVPSEYYVCMQLDVYIRHALRSTHFLYNLQSYTFGPEGFLTYHLTCLLLELVSLS